MDVSMDGLRLSLIKNYNSLTTKLNNSIIDKSWSPHITIDPEEIRNEMEQLRLGIVTLAFSYLEGHFESFDDEETHFEEFANDLN